MNKILNTDHLKCIIKHEKIEIITFKSSNFSFKHII